MTNTEEEMTDPKEPFAYNDRMVNLGPQYQVPSPELGPLERRVEKTFLEGLFSEEISVEDTNYWFEEPDAGWDNKDVYALNLEQVPTQGNSAQHFAPDRLDLTDLVEGAILTGEVVSLMLNYGVQVDLGAQYDGLIPVRGDEWMDEHFKSKFGVYSGVSGDFEVGQTVTVQIYRINHRPRCRFPIQLVVLYPDVSNKLSPPDDFIFPFDLRGVRTYEEAYAITGREPPMSPASGGFISQEELEREQLTLRTPELAAMDYSEQDIDFSNIREWDRDVVSLVERENFSEKQWGDDVELAVVEEDDDVYDESY